MFVNRSRLRMPATLALFLLVLVGSGEAIGASFCLHGGAGHGASTPGEHSPAPGEAPAAPGTHGLGHHGHEGHDVGGERSPGHHGLSHHGDLPTHDGHAPEHPGQAQAHEGHGEHDPSDPCGTLCQFLCVVAAATHLGGAETSAVAPAAPLHPETSVAPAASPVLPRHSSRSHFLPFSQAPPVLG